MTDDRGDPSPATEATGVAVFDFDGTLVRRDTLVPFLSRLAGRRRLATALAAQARRYRRDQDAAKLDVLRRLTSGLESRRVEQLGRDYAVGLHHLLRADSMRALREHRAQGHRLVIISASLGVYLRPFGATLGFDEVIAVELVTDAEGYYNGAVTGGVNVRGPEKARRLRLWLDENRMPGPTPEIWAYGDTQGDADMLAMADHPIWVSKQPIAV